LFALLIYRLTSRQEPLSIAHRWPDNVAEKPVTVSRGFLSFV
jgi:hypothetical protein